jgi:hypothetical protein
MHANLVIPTLTINNLWHFTQGAKMILNGKMQSFREAKIQSLSKTSDFEGFTKLIGAEVEMYGVKDWAYTLLDLPEKKQLEHQIGNAATDNFDEYMFNELYRYDMTISHVTRSDKPLFLSSIENHIHYAPYFGENIDAQKKIISLNKKAGHTDICNIPNTNPHDGSRSLLCLTSRAYTRNTFAEHLTEKMEELRILASVIYEVGSRNHPDIFVKPKKSFEKFTYSQPFNLLITMAVYDLDVERAADKLSISLSTAHKHLARIRNKLGSSTNYGALMLLLKEKYYTEIKGKPELQQ